MVENGLECLFVISSSSHFFNKTDFEQYISLRLVIRFHKISVTHFLAHPQLELQTLRPEATILQSKKLFTASKSIKNTLQS